MAVSVLIKLYFLHSTFVASGYTAALSRFPVSRSTLSAYYTGIPPDTDIPRFQVIQLLDGRANATDSTTRQ